MSKVLFINGNVHGHINPTLPVVEELTNRSEEVYYFSTAEFASKITACGAKFMDYGDKLTRFLQSFVPSGNHPFYTLIEFMLQMNRVIIPIIFDQTQGMQFDYIIHDSMFGGGRILASKLKIPAICSCSSFAMSKPPVPDNMLQPGFHPQLDNIYSLLKQASVELDYPSLNISDIFFNQEDLNIVYTSRLFQPQAEDFDHSFQFVGPSIAARNENVDLHLEQTGRKRIYISLGTINNKCTGFYQSCMDAFAGKDYEVILSVGNKTDIHSFEHIPDNFIIRNYVPQLEVLKKTDVFITHGGLNSVSEALYYGVPVISIPQANDQPLVTARIVKLGAGIGLKMEDVSKEHLSSCVETLLANQSYRKNCMRIRDSFHEAGGYKAAADCIMNYAGSRS